MEDPKQHGGRSGVQVEFERAGARWLHVSSTDEHALRSLGEQFGFHELDLADVRPPLQRPKLVVRSGYLFMILLFPYYHKQTREIWISEVDFFIGRDYLVTVNHGNELAHLKRYVESCLQDEAARAACLEGGVSGILYRLLQTLHQAAFPMLVHISQDIDDLEERLFDMQAKGLVSEILRIKTNIVDFRRSMQAHKPVIEKLVLGGGNGFIDTKKLQPYWNDLVDATKEIWSYLESLRETITALHETHTALLSHRLNTVMKRLTLVSVVLLPLTLIASLFGMNVEHVPFADNPYGFWMIVALLIATLLVVVGYFKSKDWI